MTMKIMRNVFKDNSMLKFTLMSLIGAIGIIILGSKFHFYAYQIMYLFLGFYFILKNIYCNIFGVYND